MSRLPLEVFLALRYLRPKRTFVSVITLISVMGVLLGVAVLIIVISVMTGFDRQLRDKILGFNAHLRVVKPEASLPNWPQLTQMIASNQHVKSASPFVIAQVMVKTQPETGNPRVAAPWVRGIDPQHDRNAGFLETNIAIGAFDLEGYKVVVGSTLASELGLDVGERLLIYSPATLQEMERKRGTKDEEAVLPDEYMVSGIFDVGYYEYNANVIVTSLRNAQDLYQLGDSVHGLMVMLDDPYQAEVVRNELRQVMEPTVEIRTWAEENSIILNALKAEKSMMFYVLFFIMIVAAFGITNSLITFVVQKTREIGVLKALGATRGQVLWLFLSQSVIVGVVGVTAGFGLGMLALHYRNEFLRFMRYVTQYELFPQQVYSFSELPALLDPKDIAIICGSALVVCVLAGLIPAWNAARLNPVEALRHE
jgi:lipoprotein-releasing system permease protein